MKKKIVSKYRYLVFMLRYFMIVVKQKRPLPPYLWTSLVRHELQFCWLSMRTKLIRNTSTAWGLHVYLSNFILFEVARCSNHQWVGNLVNYLFSIVKSFVHSNPNVACNSQNTGLNCFKFQSFVINRYHGQLYNVFHKHMELFPSDFNHEELIIFSKC